MPEDKKNIEQVEVDDFSNSAYSDDPVDSSFNITVSIPETVEIKMVNVSTLSDYEIWIFISSILSNAFLGFGVAYFTNTDKAKDGSLLFSAIVFTVLFVISIYVAFTKRRQLQSKSRDIKLKTTPYKNNKR